MKILSLLDKPVRPREIMEAIEEDRKTISARQMVAGSKNKALRECWQAAAFGIGYETFAQPCKITVLSGTRPLDFQLVTGDKCLPFETVMILQEDRKMGDEYREIEAIVASGKTYIKHISEEDISNNEKNLPNRICKAIEKKSFKYDPSVNLCIYLNIFAPAVNIEEIRETCKGLENSFESIWLLSGNHIATLFISPKSSLIKIDVFGEHDANAIPELEEEINPM
ncbi:hypothetical protein [Pelosinus sp. sgz500959]|uniref:hypothetical protein n=1 Tax=Pelosinus sp. sgz500959 TaxID=3242472 RepID=UPI00366BA44D